MEKRSKVVKVDGDLKHDDVDLSQVAPKSTKIRRKSKGKSKGGRLQRRGANIRAFREAPKETVLVSNIMLPGPADGMSGKVVLYNVSAIMANREKAELTGDLREDLKPVDEWGVVDLDPRKVDRWLKAGRLVKRQMIIKRSGREIFRNTYCEPAEWQAVLGEDGIAWLNACIEVDKLQADERSAKRTLAQIFAAVAETAGLVQRQQEEAKKDAQRRANKANRKRKKARRVAPEAVPA
jgi:hypothetical protein